MKTFNDINNDYLYVNMYDYRGEHVAEMQKWFYELTFYKKSYRPVYGPDNDLWCGNLFNYTTNRYEYFNKFTCGLTRKKSLVSRYGQIPVKLTFRDGKDFICRLVAIPCFFGWKYLLNNVKDIINLETGECIYIGYQVSSK